jgi:hypothetical protein
MDVLYAPYATGGTQPAREKFLFHAAAPSASNLTAHR